MAIHFPKNLSYQARFNAWVSGICPYCGSGMVGCVTSPTKRMHFGCTSCHAENKFTLPRLVN